ncbi:glycerate kinase [Olivibacter sp. XZL3]|uniref:glycerate kinase family protein n=1 Tax=Olivibacter sp. XZL3 TaxID=1735116 RepID=UPI001066DE56|nr:glycerate kinase [Olivibacter sp. XZL3]
MQILIAPNAFKSSLKADQVASALAEGLESSGCGAVTCFPIGDGGDGTMELLSRHLKLKSAEVEAVDPLGRPIKASYGYDIHTDTAYIEMADASGLRLLALNELNPMRTNSVGTGLMVLDALDRGARHIVIGLGGSATVDGGCGILRVLGARFLDDKGEELTAYPSALVDVHQVDLSLLHPRVQYCEFTVLTDVKNTLLGRTGAAFVFGPQKGASNDQVELLDDFMERLNCVWTTQLKKDAARLVGGGAAGGTAAGLWAMVDAELVNGIDYFLDAVGFDKQLEKAALVITGEGAIDRQTLDGKGPFGVACRAKALNIPVIGVAGRIALNGDAELAHYFDVLIPINHDVLPLEALKECNVENLKRTGKLIGNLLQIGAKKTDK